MDADGPIHFKHKTQPAISVILIKNFTILLQMWGIAYEQIEEICIDFWVLDTRKVQLDIFFVIAKFLDEIWRINFAGVISTRNFLDI